MKNEDWEREALKDEIYAQERANLLEHEYFDYLRAPAKITAKITYKKSKKYENKHNTSSLPRIIKKSI